MTNLPSYFVTDLETSVNNKGDTAVGTFLASPFCKQNRIVAYGWTSRDDPAIRTTYLKDPEWNLDSIELLVAHNAQFEMAYLLTHHKEKFIKWLQAGGKIWDTLTVEYLLTNLMHKFPSLDDTCIKYGGTLKDAKIKEYWDAGIPTEDIPREELIEYLEGDIENTRLTFLGQYAKAVELNMLPLIDCHMEAMLALVSMNLNGMRFDVKFAREETTRLTKELIELKQRAVEFMQKYFVPEFQVNPGSDQQLSAILFGGPYKYKKAGPCINPDGTIRCKQEVRRVPKLDEDGNEMYYKSGKRKGEQIFVNEKYDGEPVTKLYDYVGRVKGLGYTPHKNWELKDKRYFSVGEDNLKVLMKQANVKSHIDFLKDVIEISAIEKDLSTYFIGYTKLVWPDSGVIHPNFNTALTATGRLSASAPNLQNVSVKSGSRIKEAFVSRWGDKGRIIEADLSQIEVVVQAFLSQDEQMMKDIINGVDFHCKRLAFTLKQDYQFVWDKCHVEEDKVYVKGRKNIKVFSFQNAFGAGAQKIAETIELPIAEIREFFRADQELYPAIPLMQERWANEVEDNKIISQLRTAKGEPAKTSYITSITGKRYGYVEEDIPKNLQMFSAYRDAARSNPELMYQHFKNWGKPKATGFKPTKIKNYMVQGTAGEILCLILGELNRRLLNDEELINRCLLVNTVHDSIILDVHVDVIDRVRKLLIQTMELAPTLFKNTFGVDFNLPTRGEIEEGINWGLKKKVEVI